jgi:hypothetical protein
MSLAGVPLGSWAEYRGRRGSGADTAFVQRFALVGREGDQYVVETEVRALDAPAAFTVTTRARIGTDQRFGDAGTFDAIQVGDHAPMQMPTVPQPAPLPAFGRLDPAHLVDEVMTATLGGGYKAKHFQYTLAPQGSYHVWMASEIPPLGVLKTEFVDASGTAAVMEYVRKGLDAHARIVAPVAPFDEERFMKQMTIL